MSIIRKNVVVCTSFSPFGTMLFKLIYMSNIAETVINEQIAGSLIDCGSLSTTIES